MQNNTVQNNTAPKPRPSNESWTQTWFEAEIQVKGRWYRLADASWSETTKAAYEVIQNSRSAHKPGAVRYRILRFEVKVTPVKVNSRGLQIVIPDGF